MPRRTLFVLWTERGQTRKHLFLRCERIHVAITVSHDEHVAAFGLQRQIRCTFPSRAASRTAIWRCVLAEILLTRSSLPKQDRRLTLWATTPIFTLMYVDLFQHNSLTLSVSTLMYVSLVPQLSDPVSLLTGAAISSTTTF